MTNRKPSDGEEGPRGTFRMDHLASGEPTPVDPIPLHLQDLREAPHRVLRVVRVRQRQQRHVTDRAALLEASEEPRGTLGLREPR